MWTMTVWIKTKRAFYTAALVPALVPASLWYIELKLWVGYIRTTRDFSTWVTSDSWANLHCIFSYPGKWRSRIRISNISWLLVLHFNPIDKIFFPVFNWMYRYQEIENFNFPYILSKLQLKSSHGSDFSWKRSGTMPSWGQD